MMKLEVYTADFDRYENVAGSGMNGLCFLESEISKRQLKLEDALKLIDQVDELTVCYQKDGVQMFKKFMTKTA